MIALRSSDGETYEVEEAVLFQSKTIKSMIDNGEAKTPILLDISSKILAKIVAYCKEHANAGEGNNEAENNAVQDFDRVLIAVDSSTLYDIMMAAHCLGIDSLLNLGFDATANMIRGKTVEELRKIFIIKSDRPPEDEEELALEHAWALK